VLDAAAGIECSLYAGAGFGDFAITGRVAGDRYLSLHRELVANLNPPARRAGLEVRTETHVGGPPGYRIAEEGLSGVPPRASDRRRFTRVPADLTAYVTGTGDAEPVLSRTCDVSVGGVLLQTPAPLEVPQRVGVTMQLEGSAVRGHGTVVRADGGRAAVDFEVTTLAGRPALWEFVNARAARTPRTAGSDR
jgi:hypothetical protein